jgi:hypothetical protein
MPDKTNEQLAQGVRDAVVALGTAISAAKAAGLQVTMPALAINWLKAADWHIKPPKEL